MKKLSVTLALVLCLVLCALAFASCGKKTTDSTTAAPATTPDSAAATTAEPNGTEPAATTAEATAEATAEPTTPAETTAPETTADPNAHVHTPEAEYWIDQQPTCITPGQKSLYCEECGEQIPGSIVEIPIDPNAHNVPSWTVTKEVTLLNPTGGSKHGLCTICEQDIVVNYDYEPTISAFTETSSGTYSSASIPFSEIMNGKHFYPTPDNPAGNDLFIEYSILWNETMLELKTAGSDPYITSRLNKDPIIYWSPAANISYSDCSFAGGFEWTGNFKGAITDSEVTTPAGMVPPTGSTYADYPNIGGDDPDHPEYGWHRIGIKVHLDLTNADALKADTTAGATAATYRATATVYIDGVAKFKYDTLDLGLQNEASLLFKATSNGQGGIDYEDIADSAYVVAFLLNRVATNADKTVYVVYGDIYASCGTDFVQKVEKVTTPTAATLTVEEGVEISAPIYYKAK